MLTILKDFFTNSTFRKYFFIVLIILGFFIAGAITCNRIYNKGYTSGMEHQKTLYQAQVDKINQQNKLAQEKADTERDDLNSQLLKQKQDSTKEQLALTDQNNSLQEKLTNYEKSNSGSTSVCIPSNDDGVRILNESFPN